MRSADVVVVGGGVIGASVAYHLAARGCTNVVVIDASDGPGRGSTGRATGGFRAQFGSEVNVRLSLLSREKLLRFRDETGEDSGYRPCGYLFLAEKEETLDALDDAREVQRRCGFGDARRVDVDEVRRINPAVHADVLAGGVFCPTDGFIRPLQILRGYTGAAERMGVRFHYHAPCVGLETDGGRVTAVDTPEGPIRAGAVVNAAGAWAGVVARMAGVDLPVVPMRRQVATTTAFGALPEDMPLTIFTEDGFHLRVRDGRVLLLLPDVPQTADPFCDDVENAWVDDVVRHAHALVPCLRDAEIDRGGCWAGLYEMSPDHHAVLGRAPEVENLYLANGSSGHGVMHSPALGHLLAEIILDGRATTMDVHPLRPSRFAEGAPNDAPVLL